MKKIFLFVIFASILFYGCQNNSKQINSLDDLKFAKIGAWQASAYELNAKNFLPNAKFFYSDNTSNLIQNLLQNKIDAFVIGKVFAENFIREGININFLPQNLGDVPSAYIFPKNPHGQQICNQMNDFIKKISENGELENLQKKWLDSDESQKIFKKSDLSGENGILKICTDADSFPFIYLREGQLVGYEIEIFDKFCAAYGYDYDFKIDNFFTMLIDVESGKFDVGMNGIEIMPEREKNFIFSNPTYTQETVLVINSENFSENNFVERVKNSLIVENRWKIILEGTFTTLTITFFSIIFGSLLGFSIFMIYREKILILNKIIDVIYRTLQGVPTMVLLLFFYYVIFGNFDFPAIFVAILVFSIILSISVFIILKNGAESISIGQTEAALALGFSERRAFLKFIFPQIISKFFSTYQMNLNVILLETAIVGYISVQDLTKTADLIRARTYDAFVPIITIAAVYLILSKILFFVTDFIEKKINPRNRSQEEILH